MTLRARFAAGVLACFAWASFTRVRPRRIGCFPRPRFVRACRCVGGRLCPRTRPESWNATRFSPCAMRVLRGSVARCCRAFWRRATSVWCLSVRSMAARPSGSLRLPNAKSQSPRGGGVASSLWHSVHCAERGLRSQRCDASCSARLASSSFILRNPAGAARIEAVRRAKGTKSPL